MHSEAPVRAQPGACPSGGEPRHRLEGQPHHDAVALAGRAVAERKSALAARKPVEQPGVPFPVTEDEAQVADSIRKAFAGVVLGKGVGLWQAQAIDDYATPEQQQIARLHDEQRDWERISSADLNRCHSSLSFFDAEGMRFHLPAFLLADLEGTFLFDVVFALTYATDHNRARFASLSPAQRESVRGFLRLRRASEFDRPAIDAAIAEYWGDTG